MADESKENENFLTIQESFVLHKAEPQVIEAAPSLKRGGGNDRESVYHQAWESINASVQAALNKLHQPFYQSVADRLSSVHYDSQLSYGPPPDQQGESTPPQLDPDALAALRPFQTLHSRLYTGLLLLGGVTPSDHSGTLSGLAVFLRENGFHVAHLSLASGVRRGANEALRGLVKQLVGLELEAADVGVLRAWHRQAANRDQPIVVLLEDAEAADPAALEQLVLILSEWRSELPLFLLLSPATAATPLQRLLPPAALSLLRTERFCAPPPASRLHAIVSALFFDHDLGFALGPPVLEWLYSQYFTYHGTVTGFLGGVRAALLLRCGSQVLAPLDRFGGDKPAMEKALRGLPVGELRAATREYAGADSSSKALIGRLSSALTDAWERRRDSAAALQFLYTACQATGHAPVSLPELHRFSARPRFFDDVTRHVSTAPSPLTLFGSGGVADPHADAIKGQGRRLVGMVTRGIRELSNESVGRLVGNWREVCQSESPFLLQVQKELTELSISLETPETATQGAETPAPVSGARNTIENVGGTGSAVRSSPRNGGGPTKGPEERVGVIEENGRGSAQAGTNGGVGIGVRSSPRRVVGAAGAARQERAKGTNIGNSENGEKGGSGVAVRSSPRRVIGAAGAARQERANEMQRGANGKTEPVGGVALAVRSSPRKVVGAAGVTRGGEKVGEKRKESSGRLSEDAERMQMMHRGQSAAEKRRKALSAPVFAKDPGDPLKDRLGTLLRKMVERFITASEPAPTDSRTRFDDCAALERALSPPLRGLVEQALVSSHTLLPCQCCSAEGETGPSLHDTCTAYRLCANFDDHVSITAWYEAFTSVVGGSPAGTVLEQAPDPPAESSKSAAKATEREFPLERVRGRGRPRKRPLPEGKKERGEENGGNDGPARPLTEEEKATLQARFFQATAELQLLGLIRPSARRPEHVQKVTC